MDGFLYSFLQSLTGTESLPSSKETFFHWSGTPREQGSMKADVSLRKPGALGCLHLCTPTLMELGRVGRVPGTQKSWENEIGNFLMT